MGLFSSRKKKDNDNPVSAKIVKNRKGLSQQQDRRNDEQIKPKWEDAWLRTRVEPEEIQELLRGCTAELKSRALDIPFLLLPFRPNLDTSAARTFIRTFFDRGPSMGLHGDYLIQELRLTEPQVLCSIAKWCWSRLKGGVVGWDAYNLFKIGESDSNMARDSFKTFIPISAGSPARSKIIFDFFELLAAIAAHSKSNGLGGRKLSRLAGWWAFEHVDTGKGFDGGYKGWEASADATSHLFFAHLRSLEIAESGFATLPRSLQVLVQETEYPPRKPSSLQTRTIKVVMIVDTVSPTPFALLRRTNRFQYRDQDHALQEFSEYDDPIMALSEECCRVLKAISTVNKKNATSTVTANGTQETSWSRFEDLGFSATFNPQAEKKELRPAPDRVFNVGRPTTPSWADFMSSGFVDEANSMPSPLLLPPDKVLPPLDIERGHTSKSHAPRLETDINEDQGELVSITRFDLDEVFWWVWISSLGGEEPPERKAAFGRCALVETIIQGGKWLVMEEMIPGAAPELEEDAYIAEKKGFFSFGKRSKGIVRSRSQAKPIKKPPLKTMQTDESRISVNQHAQIQAAAAQTRERQRQERELAMYRRGRVTADERSQKTNSVFTLQPMVKAEAGPAMKWAHKYDKDAIRDEYLANNTAGRGLGQATMQTSISGSPSLHEEELSLTQMDEVRVSLATSTNLIADDIKDEEPPEETASPMVSSMTRKPVSRSQTPSFTAALSREHSADPFEYDTTPDILKVHKEKKPGGFRKLFGRKVSRAPPPSAHMNRFEEPKGGLIRRLSRSRRTSQDSDTSNKSPSFVAHVSDAFVKPQTPTDTCHNTRGRTSSETSRVDTVDAQEALKEFSNFDQDPLYDQPAFVPSSPISRCMASSPSIDSRDSHGSEVNIDLQRERQRVLEMEQARERSERPELIVPASQAPVMDRWAQIRKNAAERAAARQSEEQSRGGNSSMMDGEGETSGEETIESRVARIKARVAELTGNLDAGVPINDIKAKTGANVPVNDIKARFEKMNQK